MIGNIHTLKIYKEIPNTYGDVLNRYFEITDRHYTDGWREVLKPIITQYQRLVGLHFDKENDIITWKIYNLTEEEIEQLKQNQLL